MTESKPENIWPNFFAGLAVIILGTAGMAAIVVYGGFILQNLWNWYGVLFVPSVILSLPQAVGVSALLTMLRGIKTTRHPEEKSSLLKTLVVMTMLLAVGWIAQFFV